MINLTGFTFHQLLLGEPFTSDKTISVRLHVIWGPMPHVKASFSKGGKSDKQP